MIGKTPYIMVGTMIDGLSYGSPNMNTSLARVAIGFDMPFTATLKGLFFYSPGATGSPTGSTDIAVELRDATGISGSPGSLIQTAYCGRLSDYQLVTGFNATLQKFNRYWLVFRNNHPDPANNYFTIGTRHCATYAYGSIGLGPCMLSSTDGGSTWTIGANTNNVVLILDDGTMLGTLGIYTQGSFYSATGWTGVSFKTPRSGRMNVRGVVWIAAYVGTPPMYGGAIRLLQHPFTQIASISQMVRRTTNDAWNPAWVLNGPVTLEPDTYYVVYTYPLGTSDSSNYMALYSSMSDERVANRRYIPMGGTMASSISTSSGAN